MSEFTSSPFATLCFTPLWGAATRLETNMRHDQMYVIAWSEILHSGMRADFHCPKFDSNF